jgi:AraC family transcriptional regulator
MFKEEKTQAYNKQINEVLNYILKHLKDDLSLGKLAQIANYSPFHFQKIFKQVVGETPKQYIIKIKLESAIGFLIIHKTKSITEIAHDCGFSSPSIFARSFKNYFGVSAEELRNIPANERIKLLKREGSVKELLSPMVYSSGTIQVIVKKANNIHGIFTNSSLEGKKITNAFRKTTQIAETNDIDIENNNYIGMIYPHQELYRAVISINPGIEFSKKINKIEIAQGRFATFKIKGEMETAFKAMKYVNDVWLPNSGYRIADIFGYEVFSQNPIENMYHEIEREIYIPIEPI